MAETDHTAAIDAYFKRSSEALSRAAADPSVRAAINRITRRDRASAFAPAAS